MRWLWQQDLLTIAGAATALAASKTKLDTVTELYWGDDGTTANWEKVDDAYQYEVRLYCNESQVESMKTKKDSLDMEKKMTKEGDYTFKVRALAKSNSKEFTDGYWSEESEETYVSEDFANMIKNGGSTSQLKNGGPGKKEDGRDYRRERGFCCDPGQMDPGSRHWPLVVSECRWQLPEGRLVAGSGKRNLVLL